jgi:hypothetical protein
VRQLVSIAERYSPAKMHDSGFFIKVDDAALPNLPNEFFKITASSKEFGVLATNTATIAVVKNSRSAVELMLHRDSWEDENYYIPRQVLQRSLT